MGGARRLPTPHMFEDFITGLIQDYADRYLLGFDSKQLSISWTKGDIHASDLAVNPAALHDLHPSLKVAHGNIGSLRLKVNYLRPKSEPFIITLDDVYLVVIPQEQSLTEEQIQQIIQDRFIQRLQTILSKQNLFEEAQQEKKKGLFSSFIGNLTTAILNNIRININNLHIRYEDIQTPLAVGVTLQSLSVVSVDHNGNETFFKDDETLIRKSLRLQQFSIYCNTHFVPIQEATKEQAIAHMKSHLTEAAQQLPIQFIMQPMSVQMILQLDKSPPADLKNPKIHTQISVSNLNFNISTSQLAALMKSGQELSQFAVNQKKLEHRPPYPIVENAPKWLKYLYINDQPALQPDKALLEAHEYKQYIKLFSQHYINSNTKEGLKQCENFKKQVDEKKLSTFEYPFSRYCPIMCNTEDGNKQMHLLHQVLDQEDIQLCRSIVIRKLFKQNFTDLKKQQYVLQLGDSEYAELLNQQKQELKKEITKLNYADSNVLFQFKISFDVFRFMLNSNTQVEGQVQRLEVDVPVPDEQSKKSKFLSKKIEYRREKLPEFVGTMTDVARILEIEVHSIILAFRKFGNDDIQAKGTVKNFDVFNKIRQETEYPIIARKAPEDHRRIMDSITIPKAQDDQDHLLLDFKYTLQKNKNTSTLEAQLKPLTLVVTTDIMRIVDNIVQDGIKFANETKNNRVIQQIKVFSDHQWDRLKTYSQNTLREVVKNHAIFNVKVQMEAPIIVIPTIGKPVQSVCVVNLGYLDITSDMKEVENTTDIYDVYQMKLTDIYIFIANSPQEVGSLFTISKQKRTAVDEARLLERQILLQRTSISGEIHHCFVKNYFDAAKLKVAVKVDNIEFHVSEQNSLQMVYLMEYIVGELTQQLANRAIGQRQNDQPKEQADVKEQQHTMKLDRQHRILKAIADSETLEETVTEPSSSVPTEFAYEVTKDMTKEQISKYVKMSLGVKIDAIQLKVYGASVRTNEDQLIASIKLDTSELKYTERSYDKESQFTVQNFLITDHVENTKFICSSHQYNLLRVSAQQMKRKHPQYDDIDTTVVVVLAGISLTYDPLFVRDLTYYSLQRSRQFSWAVGQLQGTKAPVEKPRSVLGLEDDGELDDDMCDRAARKLIGNYQGSKFQLSQKHRSLKLEMSVDECSITLKKANSKDMFTKFILQNTQVCYDKYKYVEHIRVKTKGFDVYDCYQNTNHKNVIKTPPIPGQEGIEFDMLMIDAFCPEFCGYQTEITLDVKSKIEITLMSRYIQQFAHYFNSEKEELDIENVLDEKLSKMKQNIGQHINQRIKQASTKYALPKLMQLNVNISAPLIRIPISDKENRIISLDLGNLSVTSQYYIGSPGKVLDSDFAENAPIQEFCIKLDDICAKIHDDDDIDSEYNCYELLQPNNLEVKYCSPIHSSSSTEARLRGQLPGAFVMIVFEKQFQTTISTEQFDLLVSLMHCQNNFGYDIADDLDISQAEVNNIKQQLYDIKSELLKTMSPEQLQRTIRQKFNKEDQDTIDEFTRMGAQLQDGQVQPDTQILPSITTSDTLVDEEQKANIMIVAVKISIPGLTLQLNGRRDDDHEPIDPDYQGIRFDMKRFEFNMKNYSRTLKVTACLAEISLTDLQATEHIQRFKSLFKTSGEIQVQFNKQSDDDQTIQLNCPTSIQCNLIFKTIFYIAGYVTQPVDIQHLKRLKEREKKLRNKKKIQLLQQYLKVAKRVQFQVVTGQYTRSQHIALKPAENGSLSNQARSIIRRDTQVDSKLTMKIELPNFQIQVPQEPTEEDTKILQLDLQFYLELNSESHTTRKLDQNENQFDQYNATSKMSIQPQISGLSISIVQLDQEQMVLSSLDLIVDINTYVKDELVQPAGHKQFIMSEKDTIMRSVVEKPIIFKLSYSEADFFVSMLRQIQEDMARSQSGKSADVSGVDKSMTDIVSSDNEILSSSTEQVEQVFAPTGKNVQEQYLEELKAAKLVVQGAMIKEILKFQNFSVSVINNRSDAKVQSQFANGMLISLFDDRHVIMPLVEFKMPLLCLEGSVCPVSNACFTKQNFVVTAQLQADVYSQRILDWEPLIENVSLTFTHAIDSRTNSRDDLNTTLILKTQGTFQVNVTPSVIQNVQQIANMITTVFERKQKNVEYPLLYQKLNETEMTYLEGNKSLRDNRTASTTTTVNQDRANLFKSCHVFNTTSNTIYLSSLDDQQVYNISEQQHEYFNLDRCTLMKLTVYEENSQEPQQLGQINIIEQGLQPIILNNSTIYREISMYERQLYVLFRPRVVLCNKAELRLLVTMHDGTTVEFDNGHSVYINDKWANRKVRVHVDDGLDYSDSLEIDVCGTIPVYGAIRDKYLRLEHRLQNGVIDITIYPTYMIKNDCLCAIELDGVEILPGQRRAFYASPVTDFYVKDLQLDKLSAKDILMASLRTQLVRSINDVSPIGDQQTFLEQQQTSLLYDYRSSFQLVAQQYSYTIHVQRVFGLREDAYNQFQHELVLYQKVILRNMLATFNHACMYRDAIVTLRSSTKNKKAKYEVSAQIGESVMTPALENDNVIIEIRYNGAKATTKEPVPLQSANLHVPVVGQKISCQVAIQMAKNNLTRVVSVLPSHIVRNGTGAQYELLFAETNQLGQQAMQLVVGPQQPPTSCLYNGCYVFIRNEAETSSAIPLGECGVFAIHQPKLQLSVQISEANGLKYIDLFEEVKTQVEVINNTDRDVEVSQMLDVASLSRNKKARYQPSIKEAQNQRYLVRRGERVAVYLSDLSLPPVLLVQYSQEEVKVALGRLGRRKPLKINGANLFVQVDCIQNKKTVELNNRPMKRACSISLVSSTRRLAIRSTASLQLEGITVSLFQTTGECTVRGPRGELTRIRNVPVELFRLDITAMLVQKLTLEETAAYIVNLGALCLSNMQPDASNQVALEIKTQDALAASFQLEKQLNGDLYTMVHLEVGAVAVSIDQSFYESGAKYFRQFIRTHTDEQDDYSAEIVNIVLAKHFLPNMPKQPPLVLRPHLFYINYLNIEPVNITISLQITNISSSNGLLMTIFNTFSTTLAQLSNAELSFQRLQRQNILVNRTELAHQIQQFYAKQFFKNIGNIIKSAFLVGSISDAAADFGDGIGDLMEAENVNQRMKSIANLGRHALTGYLSVISSATTVVSNVTSNLTFDRDYTVRRNQQLRESRRNGTTAVGNAFKAVGGGIFEGVTGIIMQPIKQGRRQGGIGVLKGIGQGIAGIFTKPVSGVVDFVSHLSIAAQVSINGGKEEAHQQRVYYNGKILPLTNALDGHPEVPVGNGAHEEQSGASVDETKPLMMRDVKKVAAHDTQDEEGFLGGDTVEHIHE